MYYASNRSYKKVKGGKAGMDKRPIEIDFPIEQVNEIAEREAHAKEKYRPVLYIHKWWARRLGCIFRTIVLYTLLDENAKVLEDNGRWRPVTKEELKNPWLLYLKDVDLGGKIVLDPMMGGGTTVVEALRLGCKVVAQDLNPVAWFLVKKIVEPVDVDELKEAFKKLEREIADEIKKYYKTICPSCLKRYAKLYDRNPEEIIGEVIEKLRNANDPREVYNEYSFKENEGFPGSKRTIFADAMYYFWIKELPCLSCKTVIPLFRGYMLARKRDKTGYHVICPNCGDIFEVEDYKKDSACPRCDRRFNPDTDGTVEGKFYVCTNPDCGQKNVIVEAIQRIGKPKERLYAVEYYCPHCGEKNYKQSDKFDIVLFERAKEDYEKVEREWLGKYIPDTKIPKGQETYPRLIENHGYKYWKDLFNPRQILSLAKLLRTIIELDVDNKNIKELLILTFSESLNFHNMLCEYARGKNHLRDLFARHAFQPIFNPVENNIWGGEGGGRGTFKNEIEKILKGKEFNLSPFEKYVEKGKTLEKSSKIKLYGKLGDIFNDKYANVMVTCGDSSFLDIPNDSVDAIITDPPYYGNVMYSELSGFYYSWLRLVLKNKYECFQSDNVPNATEIIVNKVQGKDEKDFIEGLTAVFKECGKKLKKRGLMVFTFHHQEEKAWGAVLQSVLNAGFYVSAVYPVQSESTVNPHIFEKANVRYDMVVVCRKREEKPKRKHWSQIEDEIYFKVEEELKRLEKHKRNLSSEDIFVVTIGKCLELYSKHYPEVYKGNKKVSIEEALSSIREIVDSQLMHTRFNQVAYETDITTAIYLFYLAGKTSISYDSLNKALKMRSLSTREVINSGLVEKEGSQLLILTPRERKAIIENKRMSDLAAIDRVHYLYCLWEEGKIFQFENTLSEEEKEQWRSEKVLKTLEYLYEIEKDKTYKDIAKFLKERWVRRLTEWT